MAPTWAEDVVSVFRDVKEEIDSNQKQGLKSDGVLDQLRPGLQNLGFIIEQGKQKNQKISRPVLFGDEGVPIVNYEVDGWHPEHHIVLEVEAGRGWMGNAIYRDLIRTSLIVGAEYLVIAMMDVYEYGSTRHRDYESALGELDAIYASGRLKLPFRGILLIGY